MKRNLIYMNVIALSISTYVAFHLMSNAEAGNPAAKALPIPPPPLEIPADKLPRSPLLGGVSAAPSTPSPDGCVDVEISGQRSYNCLNEKLRGQTETVAKVPNIAPVDVNSPSIRVGTFSREAVEQQFGKNFGVSGVPFRPGALSPVPIPKGVR